MPQDINLEQRSEIYTVSQLNREAKLLLEGHFPAVWVEGEISNFAAPHSGHWYFSLKDSGAQVRCALFRAQGRKLPFTPKDGMHVLIKARISLYENRGDFQLIAEDMEERGEGKLRRAYEVLKKKLEAAGLFQAENKKPLPLLPKQLGIITSATGAAIKDILTVLNRRFPCLPVIIYPTLVQGEQAAPMIVRAIQIANQRAECDVLILSRGGGSLEDLWPFNDEAVAHAIYNSAIPLISGVGHEVDFTIADFVADIRAPTPSAAAEIITPDKADLLQILKRQSQQLLRRLRQQFSNYQQQLHFQEKHLYQQHPKRRLLEKMQHLDLCELNLVQLQQRRLAQYQNQIKNLNINLYTHTPRFKINTLQHQMNLFQQQLKNKISLACQQRQTSLANAAAKLDGLSPLSTLKRGYAIATKQGSQQIVRRAKELSKGDHIQVRLMEGAINCVVEASGEI